jgi:hypothetical protein
MKEETRDHFKSVEPFTQKVLDRMIREGVQYVQVRGYTREKHLDYVDPHYLILVPVKEPAIQGTGLDIYENINSDILSRWASEENGAKVWVASQ